MAIGRWIPVAFNQIAPKDAGGKPIITQTITDTDGKLITDALLKQCDAKDGVVDGIISERDLMTKVVAEGRDPGTTRLSDVMTPQPQTITPEKPFGYALLMMYESGFRHVPVVEDGKLLVAMADPPNVFALDDIRSLVLTLDPKPGRAFGTGTHPTTRMCLRWIAHHATAAAADFPAAAALPKTPAVPVMCQPAS